MATIRRAFLATVVMLVAIPMVRLFASKDLGWNEVVMQQVLPVQVRPGGEALIIGTGLDAAHVYEIHLINGKDDHRVEILEQCDTAIRFRIPAKMDRGYVQIAARVARYPMLLEQPLFLSILDPVG